MCLLSVSDREAALEAALKLLQQFYLDLERFLSWLTEAETTCNVLINATNKERLQEQPEAARNLLAQWKVGHINRYVFGFILLFSTLSTAPLGDVHATRGSSTSFSK